MKLSTLQRLGGISIITGSVLFTAWSVLWPVLLPVHERVRDFSIMVSSQNWIWVNALALPGVILMVFGFTAVYSRFYQNSGITGFLGFLFIVIAYIFEAAKLTWEIFIYPVMVSYAPSVPLLSNNIMRFHPMVSLFRLISQVTIFLGVILFVIALLRSREFPKSAGILILCGALIYAVGPMFWVYLGAIGVFILSAGCLILGLKLAGIEKKAA